MELALSSVKRRLFSLYLINFEEKLRLKSNEVQPLLDAATMTFGRRTENRIKMKMNILQRWQIQFLVSLKGPPRVLYLYHQNKVFFQSENRIVATFVLETAEHERI